MPFRHKPKDKYCKCRKCGYFWRYIECDENTVTCPSCGEIEYTNTMANYMEWDFYEPKESEVIDS